MNKHARYTEEEHGLWVVMGLVVENFASFFFFSLDIEVCLEFGSDKLVNLELYCVRKKNNNFIYLFLNLMYFFVISFTVQGLRQKKKKKKFI
jgi:hypothetical protein